MRIILHSIPAILALVAMSCTQRSDTLIRDVHTFSIDYQQPVFEDVDRVAKLQQAFPVVEKLYNDYAAANHFPAVAFGIVMDDQLVYSGAAGMINLKSNTTATAKSSFRIASMTKSFTAMAILKLRDDGKLSLSDPVSKYLPDMKNITYLTEDSPDITIQNLLTMSAGFPEDNPWGDRQLADSNEDLEKFIKEGISFSTSPSSVYEYSNLGFGMLGYVITRVSGMPYQEYITNTILIPLGMKHTYWEYTAVPAEQLALGYRWEDEQWKEEPLLHDGIFGAMGGLITSVEDFSRYVNFHLAAWPARNGEDTGPVKRSTVREMHKPWQFRELTSPKGPDGLPCAATSAYAYGLGWRRNCQGIERISHSGGLPGFGSEYRFYPEYGIGLICFANLTYASAGAINTTVIDTLLAITGIKPRTLPVSAILKQRSEQLVKLLTTWDESLEKEIVAENFYLDLSREAWKKRAGEFFNHTGKIISVDPIVPDNQLRGRFVVHGEKNKGVIFFTLTPEQSPKIQELHIE